LKPPTRARFRGWLPEVLFLVVTTAAGLAAGGRWLTPLGDPGIWWSLLSRLDAGQRLYRDVYLQYGPLSPYLLGLGARVFGLSSAYILLANWMAAVLCGFLLLRLGRRFLSEIELLGVGALLLALSLFAPGIGPLVLPYAPAAVHAFAFSLGALLLLDGAGGRPIGRALAAGALAGLAFCSKQEIGAAALICLIAYFLLEHRGRSLLAAGAGFSFFMAVGLAFVVWSAPDSALWRRSHVWPLALETPGPWRDLFRTMLGVTSPNWAVLVRASVWSLLCIVALVVALGLLVARERQARAWLPVGVLAAVLATWWAIEGYLLTDRFFPASLSMLVSLSVAVFALVQRELPRRSLLVAAALFATLNAARTAFAPDVFGPYSKTAQFCASLTWVLFFAVVVPGVLAPRGKAAAVVRVMLAAGLLLVGCRAAFRSFANLSPEGVVPFDTLRGTVYLDPAQNLLFSAVRKEVRPGELVLILPDANAVDVLLGVRDASPYLLHVPGWLDDEAERVLLRRLEEKPPDAVIVFHRSTWLFRVAPFGRGYGRELAKWIDQRYRALEAFPAGVILRPAPARVASAPSPYN
jgi:hypothetical protein